MKSVSSAWKNWLAYGVLMCAGGTLYGACRFQLADLPVWLPWEFSWPVFLSCTLSLAWFGRGVVRLMPCDRPPPWRRVCFVLGVVALYAVLQTRYDYLAQHMFFFHRFQHLVLHHLGPFLIALGLAGPALRAGMPEFLRPLLTARPARVFVDTIQNPAVAPALFVGLIYFWLIPAVHSRAMLDIRLYDTMNWSMAIDGLFFWCLVLNPRPRPPARLGFGMRALLVGVIVPPQILIGAVLALTKRDFYPVYRICGRILPISAISDQHYGGLILWIPPGMMSMIALLLILNNLRLSEERVQDA